MKNTRAVQLMVVLVVLALVGGYVAGNSSGDSSSKQVAAASPAADPGSFLAGIQSRGVLRVGCASSPPTLYQKPNGEWAGPDLIPTKELAKMLDVKFECVTVSWDTIVAGLQAGKYDFAADLDATPERAMSIRFTDAVWSYPGVFVVPSDTQYPTSEALINADNVKIADVLGSAEDIGLSDVVPASRLVRLPDYSPATAALLSGSVDAAFFDLGDAENAVQAHPDLKIIVPTTPLFVHGVGYGVPADTDAQSLQTIDILIENMLAAGEISRAFYAAGYRDENHLGDMALKP